MVAVAARPDEIVGEADGACVGATLPAADIESITCKIGYGGWQRLYLNPSYEPLFNAAMKTIEPLNNSISGGTFANPRPVSAEHGTRYFHVMREFFYGLRRILSGIFFCCQGAAGSGRSSYDIYRFRSLKMFYGNAYATVHAPRRVSGDAEQHARRAEV